MSETFIPVGMFNDMKMDNTIKILKEFNVKRAYLAFSRVDFADTEKRRKLLNRTVEMKETFAKYGIATTAWIVSLGFGSGKLSEENREIAKDFTRKKSLSGKVIDDAMCPMCENFTRAMQESVRLVAQTGVDMIMLDDELCQSVVPEGIGCVCDLHLNEYRKRIGEDISIDEIKDKVFTGKRNKYRDVWFNLMGETLTDFCKKLREAVNEVNPEIRMGFCAGYTSWDFEGVNAIELTKALAGDTKPILRYTCAPYWRSYRRFNEQSLQNIVESIRMQDSWAKNSGVEVMTEMDSSPRTSFYVPAAFIETVTLATKATDDMNDLWYPLSYCGDMMYDDKYVLARRKNKELYNIISDVFNDKQCVGVRIYEEMSKVKDYDFPKEYPGPWSLMDLWFKQASILPTSNSIPTTYEGTGYFGMAFGENAKYLPDSAFNKGLVIDIKAAEILQEKGIDVGLRGKKKQSISFIEHFPMYNVSVPYGYFTNGLYEVEIDEKAEVLTKYISSTDEKFSCPAVYRYENSNGQKFIVYPINIDEANVNSPLFHNFYAGRLLNDNAKWLAGEELPVVCNGNAMLYCICKQNEKETSAAYINFHEDDVYDAKIKVKNSPQNVCFHNCTGSVCGDVITIDYIKPFGFAAVSFE